MNNTFTYAIDERNLRIQLRSLQSSPTNEAWEKFEKAAEVNPFRSTKRSFQGIQVTLNRNVVLPVVFGVVICAFSLLLLNFVSIKNPSVTDTQKAELTPAIAEPVVENIQKATEPVPAQQIIATELKTAGVEPAPSPAVQEQAQSPAEPTFVGASSVISASGEIGSAQQPVTEVKKRKKKQVTIEEQIRPTTFSDETEGVSEPEPEEVPN